MDSRDPSHAPGTPVAAPKVPELDLPGLGEAMRDVFKVGGWPLAALFLAAVGLVGLLQAGLFATAVSFVQTLTMVLVLASVVTYLAMTVLGYLQWKTEVEARRSVYEDETQFQDRFMLELIKYAVGLSDTRGESTPEGRMKEIEWLTGSVTALVRGLGEARRDLRAAAVLSSVRPGQAGAMGPAPIQAGGTEVVQA